MTGQQARLDDALVLSRHAADLASAALALTRPASSEDELTVATAIVATAAALQTLATSLINHHQTGPTR
jgi:hypothetical protein